MAGLFLDQAFQLIGLRVTGRVFHQMQHDTRAAARRILERGRCDLIRTLAVRRPPPSLVASGLAGDDIDIVGNHEGGIEADAELTDQFRAFA
ncbi:hypothetical protein ATER59S_00001 [Aquamicrobium terrae]